MVDGIKAAFAKRVNTIDWMAPETKKEALKKVETIVVGLGYPETWRDYGSYSVAANSAYANEIAGQKDEYAHQLAKNGTPKDRAAWRMTQQTVTTANQTVPNEIGSEWYREG